MHPVILRTAAQLAVPRRDPADSFVLHASLELMGRVGLLPFVHAQARDEALQRIEQLGIDFEAAGDPVDEPVDVEIADPVLAARQLVAAIDTGDLDAVDAVARWLCEHATHDELVGLLGEYVVPSLAAAGHAPIGLSLLPRVACGQLPATLLRGPLREIARQPDWRLTWFDSTTDRPEAQPLFDAFVAVPRLGVPGSSFIYPLMSQVERSGVAGNLVGPTLAAHDDLGVARATISRVAAWSMLHDDPAHAPYGWSHCLTMPQAVMDLAGRGVTPRTALAVAATHIAGFRAALSNTPLAEPANPAGMVPAEADLATFAALHHDAHLVKYTLACIHAAESDPGMRPLYLHAANFLADWWRANPHG